MDARNKGKLSGELDELRELRDLLPPAKDDDQAKVLSALDELLASLDRLGDTVDAMQRKTDE